VIEEWTEPILIGCKSGKIKKRMPGSGFEFQEVKDFKTPIISVTSIGSSNVKNITTEKSIALVIFPDKLPPSLVRKSDIPSDTRITASLYPSGYQNLDSYYYLGTNQGDLWVCCTNKKLNKRYLLWKSPSELAKEATIISMEFNYFGNQDLYILDSLGQVKIIPANIIPYERIWKSPTSPELLLSTPSQLICSMNNSLGFWDLATGQLMHTVQTSHEDQIISLQISQDHKYLLSGSKKSIIVMSLSNMEEVNIIKLRTKNTLSSFEVFPTERKIVVFSHDEEEKNKTKRIFQIFDYLTSNKVTEYWTYQLGIHTPRLMYNAIGCLSIGINTWETFEFKNKIFTRIEFEKPIPDISHTIALSEGRRFLYLAGNEYYIFSLEELTPYHIGTLPKKAIRMKFTPDEEYVLFEFEDHTFAFYLIHSGQEILDLGQVCEEEQIIDYTFSFNGRNIFFSVPSGIKIIDNPLCRIGVGLVGNNVKTMRDFLNILALSSWGYGKYFDEGTHEHKYNKSLVTDFSKILIAPYNWNLLHLLALFLPQTPIIKIAIEQKIRITLWMDPFPLSPSLRSR